MSTSGNTLENPEIVPAPAREGERYFKVTFCYGCQSCMDIDPEDPDKLLRSEHVLSTEDVTDQVFEMQEAAKRTAENMATLVDRAIGQMNSTEGKAS